MNQFYIQFDYLRYLRIWKLNFYPYYHSIHQRNHFKAIWKNGGLECFWKWNLLTLQLYPLALQRFVLFQLIYPFQLHYSSKYFEYHQQVCFHIHSVISAYWFHFLFEALYFLVQIFHFPHFSNLKNFLLILSSYSILIYILVHIIAISFSNFYDLSWKCLDLEANGFIWFL